MDWKRWLIWGVVLLLAAQGLARGDGLYMPERAYPTLPTIPVQRAVIVQHKGAETLMVESAFRSKSPEVAWILPLPAAPSKLELAEPGAVSSTAYSMRPQITHDLTRYVMLVVVICLLIVPVALVIIFTRDQKRRHSDVQTLLVIETFLVLLSACVLPSLGRAGSVSAADAPGLSILSVTRLGDAEFTVLRADGPEVLDQWLAGQALRGLDGKAKPIVADYIARHWCFVVGRLLNPQAELAVPRPLMATFPAAQAVFPMKLTALANTTTHVELCVFAEQEVAADGFRCAAADRFTQGLIRKMALTAQYKAATTGMALGHPEVVDLLWNGCVGTKLVADMPADAMVQDITLREQGLSARRDHFYSSLAREQIVGMVAAGGITILLMVAAVVFQGRRRPGRVAVRGFAGGAGLLAAGTAIIWLALPTIPVHEASWRASWESRLGARYVVQHHPELVHADMTAAELRALPKQMVERGYMEQGDLINAFTGLPMQAEASPGNFTVRTVNGRVYLCTYNEDGLEDAQEVGGKE